MTHMKTGTQLKLFYWAVLIIVALQGYELYNVHHQASVACTRVRNLQNYDISAIERSEKTLPTLSYYKAHPAELKAQQKLLSEYKSGFPPVACSNNVLLP